MAQDINLSGFPITAENSSDFPSFTPPSGTQLATYAQMDDPGTSGAYYDASVNAWLVPTQITAGTTSSTGGASNGLAGGGTGGTGTGTGGTGGGGNGTNSGNLNPNTDRKSTRLNSSH